MGTPEQCWLACRGSATCRRIGVGTQGLYYVYFLLVQAILSNAWCAVNARLFHFSGRHGGASLLLITNTAIDSCRCNMFSIRSSWRVRIGRRRLLPLSQRHTKIYQAQRYSLLLSSLNTFFAPRRSAWRWKTAATCCRNESSRCERGRPRWRSERRMPT